MAEPSDDIDWVAAIVSHATRNDRRWALVRLAAEHGSFTHQGAKDALDLTAGALKGHLDDLQDAFILQRDTVGYRLTPWGEFAYRLIVRGEMPALSDLQGAQLVLATRPAEVDPEDVLIRLQGVASSIIGTDGPYRYLAVCCKTDADIVEELLFEVKKVHADAVRLTVIKVESMGSP